MKQEDAFERWCMVDDGSTFEEWYELEEERERLREQERAQYAMLDDWYRNAIGISGDPALNAHVYQQYALKRNLLNQQAMQRQREQLGSALGGVLGGLFQ